MRIIKEYLIMIKGQILEGWEVIHQSQILPTEEIEQISKKIFEPTIQWNDKKSKSL